MTKRLRNWRRAVDACMPKALMFLSHQRRSDSRATAAMSRRTTSDRAPGACVGLHRRQARKPACSALAAVSKKTQFSRLGTGAGQVGRQKMPALRTATKKMPSNSLSRGTTTRYHASSYRGKRFAAMITRHISASSGVRRRKMSSYRLGSTNSTIAFSTSGADRMSRCPLPVVVMNFNCGHAFASASASRKGITASAVS